MCWVLEPCHVNDNNSKNYSYRKQGNFSIYQYIACLQDLLNLMYIYLRSVSCSLLLMSDITIQSPSDKYSQIQMEILQLLVYFDKLKGLSNHATTM